MKSQIWAQNFMPYKNTFIFPFSKGAKPPIKLRFLFYLSLAIAYIFVHVIICIIVSRLRGIGMWDKNPNEGPRDHFRNVLTYRDPNDRNHVLDSFRRKLLQPQNCSNIGFSLVQNCAILYITVQYLFLLFVQSNVYYYLIFVCYCTDICQKTQNYKKK